MRGFPISFLTPASVALPRAFLRFLSTMHSHGFKMKALKASFRTLSQFAADSCR